MATTLSRPEGAHAPAEPDRITYGAVHLEITDRDRSVAFWRDAVGLEVVGASDDAIGLGAGGRALVVLHPTARRPARGRYAGLYHLAVHVPSLPEFARVVARLDALGVRQSVVDHLISLATYAHDPDGLTVELTWETPWRFDRYEVTATTFAAYDREGHPHSGAAPVDRAALMEQLPEVPPGAPIDEASTIGHVHLHVRDLDPAVAFYSDVIGFETHMRAPVVQMADFRAGGEFPHRLAINTWHGPDATQAPAGVARMRHVEMRVSAGDLEQIRERAPRSTPLADGWIAITDPSDTVIYLGER